MPQIKPPLLLSGRQEASTASHTLDGTNFDLAAKRAYLLGEFLWSETGEF
jgi:hypothetical protein